ncbi:hypothetical protein, partial [Lutibacter sp.]|uniref:hypothetical protein n=1 Tax=Lutibacter sp. TaxID=1925666 RepID=UPI003568E2AF
MNNLPLKLSISLLIVGFVSFFSWCISLSVFTNLTNQFLPAPIASILILIMGVLYTISFSKKSSKKLKNANKLLSYFSLVLVLFYAIDALFIINYNFENQLLIKIGNLISTEVILISPITVMVFG